MRNLEGVEERLVAIKHKALELKHNLDRIRFDGGQSWPDMLRVYSLAASNLITLQEKFSQVLEHYVLLPDFNVHEEQAYSKK